MTDRIFETLKKPLVDFSFDETVASVFPDMVKRSVPGYQTILQMLPLFAKHFGQANSCFYDLGCSLGAASIALDLGRSQENITMIAVDNSPAMVRRCQRQLKNIQQLQLLCQDINALAIENASLVVLNLTLQFIAPDKRAHLINTIFQGLNKGGALVVTEKVHFDTGYQDTKCQDTVRQETLDDKYQNERILETLQLDFKRANGYSELAIAQKRSALEAVLKTDSIATHLARFKDAGFSQQLCWYQCFNFVSLLAIK